MPDQWKSAVIIPLYKKGDRQDPSNYRPISIIPVVAKLYMTFQHQLQAAWQKSWNQKQSLMQNLRFRERGSIKSWRPETMAEAIMSVLREGHTLSQAARKYDIPYPTFVLYANRVHNLLGPSVDSPGCAPNEMRPKGRGRPQRILLGSWPDETVKNVIRAVVFRDTSGLKEQQMEEANAAAAAAAAARNNENSSHGPPMSSSQQNGRPPFAVTSAGMVRPTMDAGPRGPPGPLGPQGPLRPPIGHHGAVGRPPAPPVAPPRGQMPSLLGFPDIHMMMGMFPPGMMSSTGAVPTINLPPLADVRSSSAAPTSRSPPARPVPALSSIGPSESSPERSGAATPTEASQQQKMDTGESSEPPQSQSQSQSQSQRSAEEEPARPPQSQPPPPLSHALTAAQSAQAVQSATQMAQTQLVGAQRAHLMPQVPPLQPDSPPSGGGAEQRPLWPQPGAAERAPLPVTSPAIHATP
ncbi:protein bric-a-brac 1-like [Amphibalanus amphitrite]|uniref:protein bric-a-brac 1-like n=1 Tax=Amphibalanus amphitrite TaxID=1232801 RepID=UPI001C92180A|nr:protein bric-a-brac 1-like [Amphibalanus amphitrite]